MNTPIVPNPKRKTSLFARYANTQTVLWLVYLSLLGVLLPHTAWAFANFEPDGGEPIAWAAAFTFEAMIAVLTHKLAKHIEQIPNRGSWWRKFVRRYVNGYSFGLLLSTAVSALANFAHAVEFGGQIEIFTRYGVPFGVYALAFGGILPIASILFARVLSNAVDTEHETDPELEKANTTIKQLRAAAKEAEQRIAIAEQKTTDTEQQFAERSERFGLFERLFSDDAKERIIAARELWPDTSQQRIAKIADAAPSYVSEVVNLNWKERHNEISE